MSDYLLYVYNRDESGKTIDEIINSSQLEAYLEDGWKESPAELPGTYDKWKEALGVEEGKDLPQGEISAIGDAYSKVCEIENFILNVPKERSKKKIIAFIKEHSPDTFIPEGAGIKALRELVLEAFPSK